MEAKEGMSSGVRVGGVEAPSAYHRAPNAENPTRVAGMPVADVSATNVGVDGARVVRAEAPSAYHGAPKTDDPTQVAGMPPTKVAETNVGDDGATVKRKRGRPRKYGPGGTVTMAMSQMPGSPPASGTGSNLSSGVRGRGRGRGRGKGRGRGRGRSDGSNAKQREAPAMESGGDWSVVVTPSTDYTPHVITAEPGEDLTFKIISVAEQGPRAIWIISANGAVSNVRLRRPDTDEGSITLEGVFEIAHLSGSFMFYDNRGTMSGGLSVSLSGPNGSCIGGAVCGSLIAAGHVQVVVGSFIPGKPIVLPKEVTNQNSGEPQPNLGSSPPGQSENRAPAS